MVLRDLAFSDAKVSTPAPQPPSSPLKRKKRIADDEFATTVHGESAAARSSSIKANVNTPNDLMKETAGAAVVQSIETDPNGPDVTDKEDEGAIVLDPANSKRQYWTDPVSRVQREIWRPGDGDGDKGADYYEKPGLKAPLERRWRFYQSRTGVEPIKKDVNEPPKYVVLDDKATHECLASDIPRQHLGQFWSHEFSSSGVVRSRRPHRGRAAINNPNASGDQKFHFALIGSKGDRYYLTGEKDYKPIVYQTADPKLAIDVFRPPQRAQPPSRKKELPPNKHGHNQFTPPDQLVRLGADHKGSSWLRYAKRVNPFLTRDKSPPLRSHGGMSTLHVRDPAEATLLSDVRKPRSTPNRLEAAQSVQFYKSGSSERPAKRQKMSTKSTPFEEEDSDDDKVEKESGVSSISVGPSYASGEQKSAARSASFKPRDAGSDVSVTPRKKLIEEPDFFAQISSKQHATELDDTTLTNAQDLETSHDSGSYASKLEAELVTAKTTIEQQTTQLAAAAKANEQLEGQIADLEKACDEAKSKMDEQTAEILELKGKLGTTGDLDHESGMSKGQLA